MYLFAFKKTTKNTKAPFIFKSLKGSYLQELLQFIFVISEGRLRNSADFSLTSNKVRNNAACICSFAHLCCIPTVCSFTATYSLQVGKSKGKVRRVKYSNEKEVYNPKVTGGINI